MVYDKSPRPGESGTERSGVPDSPGLADRSDNLEGGSSPGLPASGEAREPRRESAAEPLPERQPERRGRRLVKAGGDDRREVFTPEHRLLLLDTWRRSGLPASDFSLLCGVSAQTLYAWRRRFERQGPEGLMDRPKGVPRGSRLSEVTKRTILMLKEANPEWGCQRISDVLARGPALAASATAISKVLHEAGYDFEEVTRRAHGQEPKRFERARPNALWQTDLFTFVLKRQNRRLYLVAFIDDHSRFVVGHGLHATQSSALVIEVLRAAIASYQAPAEVLTDNGSQYITWRGKSAFAKECERRGIKQVVATPRRPQTLGKIERFWGTLWKECVEAATFRDLDDARRRLALFIDHYNFQRPHQGIGGLVPADRYFGAAPEVLKTLKERVAANALDLARNGIPKKPFYLTGTAGGKAFSVHAEGERVVLRHGDGEREEVDILPPRDEEAELPEALAVSDAPPDHGLEHEAEHEPGTSPIDGAFGPSRSGPLAHEIEPGADG